MSKPTVLLLGKIPPPFIGPAIATNIILNSNINDDFELIHVNTTVNRTISSFGKGGLKKALKNINIYLEFVSSLRKHPVDIVHIPISQTTLGFCKDSIFILIASFFNVSVLIQLRGGNFKNWIKSSNVLVKWYVRFCLMRTLGVIVLGNNLRHLFEDYYRKDQIFVVPNGCDIQIAEKAAVSKKEKIQLLYFSNLLESKGIREVLEALNLLKQKGLENFELNAVGAWYDPSFKNECVRHVNENNLSVTFHNSCSGEEKWRFFTNADVFIFTPNQQEGHPWSIVEAMALSLPIISTDMGAIKESVIHGENGFIVAARSPKDIARRIEELIANETLRYSMAQKSLAHYKSNFTEQCMTRKLSHAYSEVLNLPF